jgi:hypothetical protein
LIEVRISIEVRLLRKLIFLLSLIYFFMATFDIDVIS